jgi:hypothetical protein
MAPCLAALQNIENQSHPLPAAEKPPWKAL